MTMKLNMKTWIRPSNALVVASLLTALCVAIGSAPANAGVLGDAVNAVEQAANAGGSAGKPKKVIVKRDGKYVTVIKVVVACATVNASLACAPSTNSAAT